MKNTDRTIVTAISAHLLLVMLLVLTMSCNSCTINEKDFNRLMQQEGISNIQNLGHVYTGCADSDNLATGFKGIKNGVPVKGIVCGDNSWGGKGYTIRYR